MRKDGTKYLMQYKWRCTFRDAYWYMSGFGLGLKLNYKNRTSNRPYDPQIFDGNVVSIQQYREAMSLE